LYVNELPLRHLIIHLDGLTGPKGFSGSLGKALNKVEAFKPIESKMPLMTIASELSTDQKYLYEICQTVSTGICLKNLEVWNPGQIEHARWLTTEKSLKLIIKS
jgi:hypothetical protein